MPTLPLKLSKPFDGCLDKSMGIGRREHTDSPGLNTAGAKESVQGLLKLQLQCQIAATTGAMQDVITYIEVTGPTQG